MTEYLTNYMNYIQQRIDNCSDADELAEIMREHKDKIAFMQHERIVHFLVTMLFTFILVVFFAVLLFKVNLGVLALVTIVLVLLGFYIKHYYFLENTVQKMYKVYDSIQEKEKKFKESYK